MAKNSVKPETRTLTQRDHGDALGAWSTWHVARGTCGGTFSICAQVVNGNSCQGWHENSKKIPRFPGRYMRMRMRALNINKIRPKRKNNEFIKWRGAWGGLGTLSFASFRLYGISGSISAKSSELSGAPWDDVCVYLWSVCTHTCVWVFWHFFGCIPKLHFNWSGKSSTAKWVAASLCSGSPLARQEFQLSRRVMRLCLETVLNNFIRTSTKVRRNWSSALR